MKSPHFTLLYIFALLISAFSTSLAEAQSTASGAIDGTISGGGGGNAIVCFNSPRYPRLVRTRHHGEIPDSFFSHVTSIEILDLYEARLGRGFEASARTPIIRPLRSGETYSSYVDRMMGIMQQANAILFSGIDAVRTTLTDLNISSAPHGVARVDDARFLGLFDSTHCVLATMGHHRIDGRATTLSIDSRMFDHANHSELSRAWFLIHEYTYIYGRLQRGHTDSANTRVLLAHWLTTGNNSTAIGLSRLAVQMGFIDSEYRAMNEPNSILFMVVNQIPGLLAQNRGTQTALWANRERFITRLNTTIAPFGQSCTSDDMEACLQVLDTLNSNGTISDSEHDSVRSEWRRLSHEYVAANRPSAEMLFTRTNLAADLSALPVERMLGCRGITSGTCSGANLMTVARLSAERIIKRAFDRPVFASDSLSTCIASGTGCDATSAIALGQLFTGFILPFNFDLDAVDGAL